MRTWLGASALVIAACGGGGGAPPLREWQPSDHQPPAAVAAEGQGEGADGADPRKAAATALWEMRCASCHGPAGRGDGSGRPPGAALPDFTRPEYHASRSDEQLAQVVMKGKGLMPAFGDQLSEAGVAAIVGHVRSLRAN